MAKSKKPRKAYNPHKLRLSHMETKHIAIIGAAKLQDWEKQKITKPILDISLNQILDGRSVSENIASMVTAIAILTRAEKKGIVTGMGEYIEAAQDAIDSICCRARNGDHANPWVSPQPTDSERRALLDMKELLLHVLDTVSVRELDSIARYIYSRARSEKVNLIVYQPEEATA